MKLSTLLSTVVTAKCACIRNTNVCFFSNVCETTHIGGHCTACRLELWDTDAIFVTQNWDVSQVGQQFNLRPNFELRKWRQYPIIPTGMRYNGHQCQSFHWFIIYTVVQSRTVLKLKRGSPEIAAHFR